ncbi:MAG: DUF3575 domain-containing protein, partial [Alistipes sp.]
QSAKRVAYRRNSRVKSELITRAGAKEEMFVTDYPIPAAYGDTLRNVVVVTFPASETQVEKIAGTKAADGVRSYNRAIEEKKIAAQNAKRAAEEAVAQQKAAAEAQRKADEQRQADEQARLAQEAQQKALLEEQLAAAAAAEAAKDKFHNNLNVRTNLLRWATLTPDLGVEWRINRRIGIAINGTWTSWSWNDKDRRYALWNVSPEFHYYMGSTKRGYIGAMYQIGEFNYKFNGKGRQGDHQGGGIVGGYILPLNKALSLDFNIGVGYTHADYDSYNVINGIRVRAGKTTKNYWGINKAGITLVWKLF